MSSAMSPPPLEETHRIAHAPRASTDGLDVGRMLAIALAAGLMVFLVAAGMDWLLLRERESRILTIGFTDSLAALVAVGLMFRILQYERERRLRLRQKLEVIAEMNHHIRNALQVISFSAASSSDQRQLEAIRESMQRIQWALREILPKV